MIASTRVMGLQVVVVALAGAATLLGTSVAAVQPFSAPSAVPSKIVAGLSIGGVRLEMPSARVKAVAGEPKAISSEAESDEWRYRTFTVWVNRPSGKVDRVVTTSSKQRTRGGIGVGSSKAALLHSFPWLTCSATTCTWNSNYIPNQPDVPNGWGMFFGMKRGKVISVEMVAGF